MTDADLTLPKLPFALIEGQTEEGFLGLYCFLKQFFSLLNYLF